MSLALRLADFDYELPPELIAQTPADRRDASRLCVLPASGPVQHRAFVDLPELLPEGALLVVNDTRVVPARLWTKKPSGGKVEILLVAQVEADGLREIWSCLVRAKSLEPGTPLEPVAARGLRPRSAPPRIRFLGRVADELCVEIEAADGVLAALSDWGEVPLPPYIERAAGPTDVDRDRYQTVFADRPGAVAAPTAGLHFTDEILERLARRGIERASVTLHVGPGTFAPVRVDDIAQHTMHAERFDVPPATAAAHAAARAAGRPIVAVGTTVVRTLESALDGSGRLAAGPGQTRLFLHPGKPIRAVDLLVTNFHMPRSTLLMLVCAFAGTDRLLAAYRDAIRARYRFFSYGDAMLLERA
jgi:S-adenosylmethionine:tRNA ribosyltransferase-isomerase